MKVFYKRCLSTLFHGFAWQILLIAITISVSFDLYAQQTFTNFQEANIVLGQNNFESGSSGTSFTKSASSVAVSINGNLAVGSKQTGKIWLWNSVPTTNGVLPDVTLNNIETEGLTFSPDGTLLIATDAFNGRVLVWDGFPTADDQPHDYVLSGFTYPTGVAIDPTSGKLVVSDFAEDNIRVFSQPPSDAGSATLLLTYGSRGTDVNKFYGPWGCAFTSTGQLVIADRNNHRVMIFSGVPTSTGFPASTVIGQADFTSNSPGTSATTLYNPAGVAISPNGQLAIGEWANSRVSIFNNVPFSNGATIDVILGQPVDFSNNEFVYGSPTSQNMARVGHIAFDKDGRLFVSGENMNRVMVFGESSTPVPDEIGPDGGTVSSDDNVVSLNVPANALTTNTVITGTVTTAHPAGNLGIVYDFQPDGLSFASPAELVFDYSGLDLGGLDPNDLTVAYAENGQWIEVPSEVNTTDQTITAQISHFTPYGIIEKATEPAPPSAVQTFPNGFGGMHTLFLDENNQLWAGGYNAHGACGVGDFRSVVSPMENISNNGDLAGKIIISVASGVHHSLALDDEGNVYSWGYNYHGQLGLGDRTNRNLPKKIPVLSNIKKINTGIYSSVAISHDGYVYTWGFGSNAALGYNLSSPYQQLTPRLVGFPASVEIVDVAIGTYHGIALTSQGEIYGWGQRPYIGHGSSGWQYAPTLMTRWGYNNVQIASGYYNSYALTGNGYVLATGINRHGQIGQGNISNNIYYGVVPVRTSQGNLSGITKISAGWGHILAINDQKEVYSWGYNPHGQVGIGSLVYNVPYASLVKNQNNSGPLMDIIEIFGAHVNSYAKSSDGSLYGWGYNYQDQIGSEYPNLQPLPVPLNMQGSIDEPPTILIQNITISLDVNGQVTITPEQVDNGSSDDSGELTLSLDIAEFNCENIGENTVTLTGTDGNGNSAEATAVVTVVDDVPPVLSMLTTKVYLDENGQGTLIPIDIYDPLNSSDNCGIDESTLSLDITTFECSQTGAQVEVTLSVQDVNGNESTASIAVDVVDEIPPSVMTRNITVPLDATGNATITTEQVYDGSADNCSIASMTLDLPAFTCDDMGDNIVSLTVEDASKNVSTATATVTVVDNTPPVARAKDIVVSLNNLGLATITPSDIDNNSSDNCRITDYALSTYNFNYLNLFTPNQVILTVTDQSGNSNTAIANVTVIDNFPPVVQTQNITIPLDASGNASITPEEVDNGTEDFGGVASRVLSQSTFSCGDLGDNTILFTATDNTGNSAKGNAIVTIVDNVAPIALARNINIPLDDTGKASITAAQIDNGSSDACGIASLVLDKMDFDCSNVGPNLVTLTVTDNNGNISTATATVTVEDNVAPAAVARNLTIPLDATGNASITTSQIDNGSSDACSIASLVLDKTDFDCSNVGPNLVTLTVTDNNSNISTTTAIVTVEDNVAPVAFARNLTIPLDATGNASITTSQIDDGSSDACGIASLVLDITDFDCTNVGPNLVTLTVTDNNGNVSTATATVTVEDNVAPEALARNLTIPLDATGNASITTAQIDDGSSDACGIASLSLSQTSFDCGDIGANIIELSVTDNNGNVSTATATVTIEDNVAPVAVARNLTISLDATGNASITAEQIDNGSSDACGIASLALDQSAFGCSHIGVNVVTLTVTDINGNVSTATSNVTVEDNTPPIALAKNLALQLDANGQVAITASDIDNGSNDACGIASTTISKSVFDCSNIGVNTVVLTVTDVNGNVSTANSDVIIEDKLAPTVLTKNISIELDVNGVVAIVPDQVNNRSTDNCGIATLSLDITDFNCSNVGENTVMLTATDNYGNASTTSAIVTVIDKIAPVVLTQDITAELDVLGIATISAVQIDNGSADACGIAALLLSRTSFSCSDVGANTILLTVTDVNGNSSTASATVMVQDLIKPEVQTNDLIVVLDQAGQANITIDEVDAGSSDACGIDTKVLSRTNFSCGDVGVNTETLTVTDVNGNMTEASFIVTVKNQIPVVESLSLPLDPQQVSSTVVASATFKDENLVSASFDWGDGNITSGTISGRSIEGDHEYTIPGVYSVMLTITDICGETASEVFQYVVVFDPSGGFVTGGGWVWSAPGNYIADPDLEGKANFGFVAKYRKGANVPEGNTEFKFKAGDLNFKSTSYEWLVVAGKKAKYKGEGTINGDGSYKFMLSAIDDDKGSGDKFRIKIWTDGGGVIYDNQPGAGDAADATTLISGGSIQVHDGKNNKNARISAEIAKELELDSEISVYPNPFVNSLSIRYVGDESVRKVDLSVVDISGRRILSQSYNPQVFDEYELNIGDRLSGGIYFIQIYDGMDSRIFKIKKE